jgi:NTE family protein
MRRNVIRVVLIFITVCGLSRANAAPQSKQNEPTSSASAQESRPKIGLALEGGGALGLAHIGVLQWFDAHHIPVDYIAGTSMGGLVGGLYATGKSPEELKNLVEQQKWEFIIGGQTPYEDLSFRRKEDSRAYPNSFVAGLKNGFSFPAGLNAGHQINLLIDRETLPYSEIHDFDQLPIPFRCVATDLVSGKEVVFHDGSLANALRATISIPGLFSPVREGNNVYVDGGLLRNLPTDVVRQMGADIVIAVHLETAPVNAQELRSLFKVLDRSIDVVVRDNEIRGLAGADLVINVDLKNFDSLDYAKADAIIKQGLSAAEEKSRVLAPYSLDDAEWQSCLRERDARKRTAVPTPQFVKVEGTTPQSEKQLERFLKPLVGKPLDTKKVANLLTRLTGFGKYESAGYRLTEENGQTGLVITVHEKTYAPPSLQFGFEMDGSESENVNFTLGSRVTFMDVAGYRSEWRTDLLFGNTYGIATELYRPFAPSYRWFFAPHAESRETAFHIYRKVDPLADYSIGRSTIGDDLGYSFSRFVELRFGYEVGFLDTRFRLGTPQFPAVEGRTGDARLRFVVDHTDDPVIPRSGFGSETTFRWFDTSPGATESFPSLREEIRYFHPISRPASLFVVGEGGSTFDFRNTGMPQFFLGGPLRLSAYGTNELFGDQYYAFRFGYLHELAVFPPFFGKHVYAVANYEFAKMYGFANESKFPNDFAAGVIAQTALGPFFIGGSVGDSGHQKWFFQLGRVF